MIRISKGTVHLFTFKDGLLARLAHDLRLSVRRFRITLDGTTVNAEFMPESIQIDGTMREGTLDPNELSDKDKGKIKAAMLGDVLRASQYARVSFTGRVRPQAGAYVAKGTLTLVGKKADVAVTITREGELAKAAFELAPSEWGIKPYSALAGAIKLQDRVGVAFEIPIPPNVSV